jgi:hypothetical protein
MRTFLLRSILLLPLSFQARSAAFNGLRNSIHFLSILISARQTVSTIDIPSSVSQAEQVHCLTFRKLHVKYVASSDRLLITAPYLSSFAVLGFDILLSSVLHNFTVSVSCFLLLL